MIRRVKQWREALKAGGLTRKRRWQLLAAVVGFYLIRDLVLYVLLPALIWIRARP